jgi:hypothetical protein
MPAINAGPTPEAEGGDAPPPIVLADFAPVAGFAEEQVEQGAAEVSRLARDPGASGGSAVQRDPGTGVLKDLTPAKLDADIRRKRRNALLSLWNPISGLLNKIENAIVGVAEKVAEIVLGAIMGVATAVLGPVGTLISAVANWFFGGSIKAWVGRQIRRLIKPILAPLRKELEILRTHFAEKVESLTDKPLEVALGIYRAVWNRTMTTFRPVIRFYVDCTEWIRKTLAEIGIDVSKVPILKDIVKAGQDMDAYGKPEQDPGPSLG